jgi:DnaJ homologue, subfamily C, member 28, conserved domain
MTERKPPGMSFETWVDRQIEAARERGAFEGLAGAGKPLTGLDREETGYDWALRWARRENGDVAGMLPPGLALRRERDLMPGVVPSLPSEAAVRAMAEDYNDRVRAFWRRPQEGPPVVPGLADADVLVRLWRATRPPTPPPAPPPPAAPGRRRWFRRRR